MDAPKFLTHTRIETGPQSLSEIVGEKLRAWADDPVLFVEETMGISLDVWQKMFLRAINKHSRVACRSGHGVGKSASIALTIIWFLFTRYPAKIIVTAPKADQLEDAIWSEVAIWRRKLPRLLQDSLIIQSDIIYIAGLQKENFAVARTARKDVPEGLQGQHSANQLSICEEASGIPEGAFDVIEGTMTTKGSKLVLVGNPTRVKGYFFNAFHKDKARFYRLKVSSEKARLVDKTWLAYMQGKYPFTSNTYRVRVLGEFPTEDASAVIPLWLAEEARNRELLPSSLYKVTWGVDVAYTGNDRTALAKRMGDRQLEPVKFWYNKDNVQVADLITEEYDYVKTLSPGLIPEIINVDLIGWGAGVFDILSHRGLPVAGINVAEASSNKPHFYRKRDELWFAVRTWLDTRRVSLCDDEELIDELTLPHYQTLEQGMKKVESKKEIKSRMGRGGNDENAKSPDLADAFVLTFASGYDKLYNEVVTPAYKKVDAYDKKDPYNGMSWLTL